MSGSHTYIQSEALMPCSYPVRFTFYGCSGHCAILSEIVKLQTKKKKSTDTGKMSFLNLKILIFTQRVGKIILENFDKFVNIC